MTPGSRAKSWLGPPQEFPRLPSMRAPVSPTKLDRRAVSLGQSETQQQQQQEQQDARSIPARSHIEPHH